MTDKERIAELEEAVKLLTNLYDVEYKRANYYAEESWRLAGQLLGVNRND